jgi:hypothetical protein
MTPKKTEATGVPTQYRTDAMIDAVGKKKLDKAPGPGQEEPTDDADGDG